MIAPADLAHGCAEPVALEASASSSERMASGSTDSQLFIEGDELFAAMIKAIAAARENIRMESYIFADDAIGQRVAQALIGAACNGCNVHLRVDYVGSRWVLGDTLVRQMRSAGIRFDWSHRWAWSSPQAFGRRNHRKLLILDEGTAYLGGFNIHAASSRAIAGEARWRDTHVRFQGPAVHQALAVFEQSGRFPRAARERLTPFWILPNTTARCRRRLRCEFNQVLASAIRRIWLTTPYFVPDRRLRRRLAHAAQRGVDVRVLTPAISDVPIARWAAHAAYDGLLQSGVRIFEYRPRVLHAKTLVVDERWSTVGTANFDYRSLYMNAEINLIATDALFCERLAEQFLVDLGSSREIHGDCWQGRSWYHFVREGAAWLVRRWL